MMPPFSSAALEWMESHAINPATAAACAVTETGDVLRFEIVPREGSVFTRTRRLPGPCLQPKGVPLAPWWPNGYRETQFVLIVEGEGDALAVASVKSEELAELAVVALPGAAVAHQQLVDDLVAAGVKSAVLALDADDAGRKSTAKLANRLTGAGIACLTIELPDGFDLADLLAESPDPAATLSKAISGAQLFIRIPPAKVETPRRTHYRPLSFEQDGELTAAIDYLRSIAAAEYLEPIAGVGPLPGGRVRCPLPDHDDLHPSASYRGAWWYCHACGTGGDLFVLVAAITGRSTAGPDFLEVAWWAAERLGNPAAFERPDHERGVQ